ncbi:MAG: tetratricopeptide repeat protein [Anaerolineales bacterium]|nr:tetratricopeptide repeat protein [Anaerolineales bacterium]
MSQLSFYLLGRPRLEHDGAVIKIERRKAMALLAYLAVTGESHSRESLAALLWPENQASRAYAYLRNALWVLNQTPLVEWLQVGGESLELRQGQGLWVDVRQFRELLAACRQHGHSLAEICPACPKPLAQAVELHRGDFMAGFALDDSAAFEEWQFFEAEGLRQELASALEKLVRFHTEQGNLEPAIEYARRWLALDAWNEPLQSHLMTLYARSGHTGAALRQYEAYARSLQQEMRLQPGEQISRLRQRIAAGELQIDAARRQARPPMHNLPLQPTPFVGRGTELAEIQRLLGDPDCRLLTLTGLGGCGKTRLALQVAAQWMEKMPDGVFFVPLASVSAPGFIVPTIIDALRLQLSQRGVEPQRDSRQPGGALQTLLLNYLRDKRMLLVLDNFEHLLEGVSVIEALLNGAPAVRLLLTSHERLGLSGEWALEVHGLSYPPVESAPVAYENYDAVQLFLQSARRSLASFAATKDDLPAVGRICQLVDGAPLGIELAATWIKVLSPQEIAAEIEHNLDFLSTTLRDVPERHRSLRAVFARSWTLLSGDGRACFRKLAVFQGGFTRQAAGQVAGASLAALASLVDKSLLRRAPAGRYEMHELLRQFAEERLTAVPREGEMLLERHSAHYLELLRGLEKALKGEGQKDALETLRQEIENIRQAWRWAATHGKFAHLHTAAMGMFLYYDIRNHFQEGAETFAEAVSALSQLQDLPGQAPQAPEANQDQRALLGLSLMAQGWFEHFSSMSRARELFEAGSQCLESLPPRWELAFANVLLAFSGEWDNRQEIESQLRVSVDIYQATHDAWGEALALEVLGSALAAAHKDGAEEMALRSLNLRRQLGDLWGCSLALFTLAWIAESRDDLGLAKERYHESLEFRRKLGEDQAGVALCLNRLGHIALKTGEYGQAQELFNEDLRISQDIGSRQYVVRALAGLGRAAYVSGDYAAAWRLFEQSLHLAQALGETWMVALFSARLGGAALAQGDHSAARAYFESSLEIDPQNPLAALGLSRLWRAVGDQQAAGRCLRQALSCAAARGEQVIMHEALVDLAQRRIEARKVEQGIELLGLALRQRSLEYALRLQAQQILDAERGSLPSSELEAILDRIPGAEIEALVAEILETDELA